MPTSTTELKKALQALQAALALPKTDITRDAAIQRFEFTIELAWKVSKKKTGSASTAPKTVVREMAQAQLIADPSKWFEFIEARNLSSHTYKEDVAEAVFKHAVDFANHCDERLRKLERMP